MKRKLVKVIKAIGQAILQGLGYFGVGAFIGFGMGYGFWISSFIIINH